MRKDSFVPNPDLLAFRNGKLLDLDHVNPLLIIFTGKSMLEEDACYEKGSKEELFAIRFLQQGF